MTRTERQRMRRMSEKVTKLEARLDRVCLIAERSEARVDESYKKRYIDWVRMRQLEAQNNELLQRLCDIQAIRMPTILKFTRTNKPTGTVDISYQYDDPITDEIHRPGKSGE